MRESRIESSAVVLVATIRALKYHGGIKTDNLKEENLEALRKGMENLEKHVENMKKFNICPIVTLNKFVTDTEAEIQMVKKNAGSWKSRWKWPRYGPKAEKGPKN